MSWLRRRRPLVCPVCDGLTWSLPSVSLDAHPTHFLKSRFSSMEGPWGTCTTCGNSFHFGLGQARLMDRPGGYPVENAALLKAIRAHHQRKREANHHGR